MHKSVQASDAIDIKTATKNKIAVTNTPVAPVSAVCELSVALILSLTRGIHTANINLHRNQWIKYGKIYRRASDWNSWIW